MKTFLYSARKSICQGQCTHEFCICKCVDLLNGLLGVNELVILNSGSRLTCRPSMLLRTGDLIVLYAADDYELDELIVEREVFEPYRVVLILGRDKLFTNVNYHKLNPRYRTSLDGNWQELDSVLLRMSDSRHTGTSLSA